jgi:hypothetical protein
MAAMYEPLYKRIDPDWLQRAWCQERRTVEDIADRCGVSVDVVHYARIKWGIYRARARSGLDVEQIRTLYHEQGLTLKQIGARLSVHGNTVRRCMVRHDIPRRPRWASGQHLERG